MRDRESLSSKRRRTRYGLMLLVLLYGTVCRASDGLPRVLEIEDPIRQRTFEGYKEQLAESPQDPRLLERHAMFVYQEMRDVAAARQYFELAIAQYDKQPAAMQVFTLDARMSHAHILEKYYKDYEAAAKVYERVIEINPDYPMGYLPLAALCEKQLNDLDRAETLLKNAASGQHADVAAICAYSSFLARRRGDCESAERVIKEPLDRARQSKRSSDFHLPLILALAKTVGECARDFERSSKLFAEYFAANESPSDYQALEHLADLHALFGAGDGAVEAEYQRRDLTSTNWQFAYAEFLCSRGRLSEANAWLSKALDGGLPPNATRYDRWDRLRPLVLAFLIRDGDGRSAALTEVKAALDAGVPYPTSGINRLVALAERLKCPEIEGLRLLARVLEDEENEAILNEWPAWRSLGTSSPKRP